MAMKKKLDNPENIPGGGGGNSGWGRGRGGNANGGGLGGDRLSPKSGGKPEPESFSYRSSELSKAQRTQVKAQNEAAKTGVSKDLDAVERGAKAATTRANNQAAKEEYAHNVGMAKGKVVGAVAGLAAGVAADELVRMAAAKPKGTQAGHKVTDWSNHTQKVK